MGKICFLELQLVVLERLLKATTKKVVNLLRKKLHPRQNPGYAYNVLFITWVLVHISLFQCPKLLFNGKQSVSFAMYHACQMIIYRYTTVLSSSAMINRFDLCK